MTDYFDTSVIYAALVTDHELQVAASSLIQRSQQSGHALTTTLHTTAELYNNLTRQGIAGANWPPAIAVDALRQTVLTNFDVVTLDQADYLAAVERCKQLGLIRGVIYDALHYQAALKAGATTLYTDNLRDFERLKKADEPVELVGLRSQ